MNLWQIVHRHKSHIKTIKNAPKESTMAIRNDVAKAARRRQKSYTQDFFVRNIILYLQYIILIIKVVLIFYLTKSSYK